MPETSVADFSGRNLHCRVAPASSRLLSLLSLLLLCGGHARAAADGWLAVAAQLAPAGTGVDFTPHGTQPGLTFPMLASEEQCVGCHGATSGTNTTSTFRPFTTWSGSMMANATRDPLFFAALDVANHDAPGIGDYCLRCHTSNGWYAGDVVKAGFGEPDNDVTMGAAGCLLKGSYDAVDDSNSDYGGVTCHFCHRIVPQGPNGEPTIETNANVWIDDASCGNLNSQGSGPCRHGPYDYAQNEGPPHAWAQSDFHTQSGLCGQCHNVDSPDTPNGPLKTLKLNDGTETGLSFPVERTYSEWQNSQFAEGTQTCQGCHMPASEDPTATACLIPGFPVRNGMDGNATLPVHEFVGGNTWMPAIIKGQYAAGMVDNGAEDRSASYDQTVEWARQLLGTAATVTTTLGAYTPPGTAAGSLAVEVKVVNNSGHKMPTGYAEGRRMWLNVQVKDANGGLVFESAAYDPDTAELTRDAQARIYEVLQGVYNPAGGSGGTGGCDVADTSGNPVFHFVLNDCIAKDNRIPPLGFSPVTSGDPNGYEMRPVGATYPETSPGSGILVNYDTVDYVVPVPVGTVGPLTATARLYYQTSSKDYITFLRDQAVEYGVGENQMCSAGPNRPFDVGPQGQTRGEYAYALWNNPAYGKSPPELLQTASATLDEIFGDGFDGPSDRGDRLELPATVIRTADIRGAATRR